MKLKKKAANPRQSFQVCPDVSTPKNYHWKVLDCFVEDLKGYLLPEDSKLLTSIIRKRDFAAYLELDSIWGLQCINSQSGPSLDTIKARYAVSSLLKKYLPDDVDLKELDNVALEKFYQADWECGLYNRGYSKRLLNARSKRNGLIQTHMRSFLLKLLGRDIPIKEICDMARHGPGANLGTHNGNISTYFKYAEWPYTCTPDAAGYAWFMISRDQRWLGALYDSYRERNKIPQHYPIDKSKFIDSIFNFVDHNRVTFVPKTAKTSRSIAIEPALNLMLQLGVDGVIRRRLKRWNIDIDDQGPNQLLSRLGSKWGLLSTIDLSSASDLISLRLCKELLPENWYHLLMKLRSPKGVMQDGTELIYEKMSSMGNGFTFALETAIFAACVYAALKIDGVSLQFGKNSVVFGDDIIVPTECYSTTVEVLTLAGFSINHDKSFCTGFIRESCGTDWYDGSPIRPIFLVRRPKNIQELFIDLNRLQRFLDLRFGITESLTVKLLKKWVPTRFNRIEGPLSDEVFDSWIHKPVPKFSWFNGLYYYPRLILTPKVRPEKEVSQFFFRRLMHNLRGGSPKPFYLKFTTHLGKPPLTAAEELFRKFTERLCDDTLEQSGRYPASGSRFSVTGKLFTVRQTSSFCSVLQKVYAEHLPPLSRKALEGARCPQTG